MLQSLLAIGKRAVVVLNKADRYPPQAILTPCLQRLRSRVVPPLADDDVVAIAANPQPMQTETGGWLQMRPKPDAPAGAGGRHSAPGRRYSDGR